MDNNNKNNYDDFFKGNEGARTPEHNNQEEQSNPSSSASKDSFAQASQPANDQANPSYGSSQPANDQANPSYGSSQPANEQANPSYGSSQPANDQANPSYESSQPANEQGSQYYNAGHSPAESQQNQHPMHYYSYGQQRQPEVITTTDQSYYPYNQQPAAYAQTEYQNAAGGQQASGSYTASQANGINYTKPVKEKKKGVGFGKMFLSFLSGVLVVGALMYTADVQNWFTKEAVVQTQSSNSGSQTSTTEAGSTASSSLFGERPDNIAQLFKTASPAVVKIETYAKGSVSNGGSSLLDDPFFRQFFGDSIPRSNGGSSSGDLQQSGMGTGFFFEASGYILTNQHVIADADEIKVLVEGYDQPFVAKLLGSSFDLDLAVLKIEGEKEFPTLPLGSSDNIQIGDWVVAIGNPYGFDHTLTVGVLSAKERPINIADTTDTRSYENLLQTDASINPGNSGGPLLNVNGEVIGINTAVSSTAQGIGFAIPTSTITEVLDKLKNNEQLPADQAPFIGAELQNISEEIAAQAGLDSTEGTIVRSVYYNSPAYVGGMKQYDVITGVDNQAIKSTDDLTSYIKSKEVGTVITLKVIRDGKLIELQVSIGDRNEFGLQ